MGVRELEERSLKAAWLALDGDGSGRLTAGEFGKFMRLGAESRDTQVPWRERVHSANRREAEASGREMHQLLSRDVAASMSGEACASGDELRGLSERLNQKMHELFSVIHNGVPTRVSWFRLFQHMDDDKSGLISYAEFSEMVCGPSSPQPRGCGPDPSYGVV